MSSGNRVLPDQLFLGHFGAQVARARAEVPVGQLEPGAGEGFSEGLWVVAEFLRDLAEFRIEAQRQVRRQHRRFVHLAGDVRVGDDLGPILCDPLLGAGGRLGQFPLVLEQVLEEVVAPARRGRGPGYFQAARDSVLAMPATKVAGPAKALRLDRRAFGFRPLVRFRRGAVRLAEGVAAGDEGDDFLVVHRHAVEGGADVLGGSQVVATGVGPLGIHVDEAHVGRGQRPIQITVAREALVGGQPRGFRAPVDVGVRFPDIFAAACEAERAEAHRLEGDVAGEDQQVGPGDRLTVFLLDRPQQAARLVDVHVVRPAVERREALLPAPAAAAPIADAVGARGMPGHADELRAVVTKVGRPPVLRIGHQRQQVLLQGRVVKAGERLAVVEVLAQRIGLGGMLVQDLQLELVRPPVLV